MPRLPKPGGDSGSWGDILNEYLSQAHNSDGTLRDIPQSKIIDLTSDISTKADISALAEKLNTDDLDTQTAAKIGDSGSATADALMNSIAQTVGAVFEVSDTPPEDTERYGVPVVWINTDAALILVPVSPESPTWDDALTNFTIPTGVVGVDYFNGTTKLTQGTTYDGTMGATTTITTAPQPGYMFTGTFTFRHSFPNPNVSVLRSSDAFTGGDAASISLRSFDNTLGGSEPAQYALPGAFFSIVDGVCVPTATPGWHTINAGVPNHRVEFDVVEIVDNGGGASATTTFTLAIGGAVANRGVNLQIGKTRLRIQYSNDAGGSVDLTSGTLTNAGVTAQYGTYALQIYLNTVTLTLPNGTIYTWDVTYVDTNIGLPDSKRGNNVTFRHTGTQHTVKIDNLKIWQIG